MDKIKNTTGEGHIEPKISIPLNTKSLKEVCRVGQGYNS